MASSDSSTEPPPPGTMNHLPSTKPTFCDSSCNRDGISRGRCVASSDRSATRDERLAERTDANVAPASTSVPPAVARAEIVTQSATPQVYGPQSPGAGAPARRRTMSRDSRRSRKDANMINDANTGFMLLAASLVMLMTPGLAFFYGGLVGRAARTPRDRAGRLDRCGRGTVDGRPPGAGGCAVPRRRRDGCDQREHGGEDGTRVSTTLRHAISTTSGTSSGARPAWKP